MFEPGPLPTHEAITLDWDTPGAVLQGLRGLPLNYIRPLVPPSDAVIERSPETGPLAELQLNSAEQKLLALLVGRHPMEQLLALDFIANESLLRGLVTFAALGLIVVHPGASREDIPVEGDDADGEHIDPLDQRPPVYVKQPALVPEARPYVAPKVRPPTNEWPDPVPRVPPSHESNPGEGWTAQPAGQRKPKFVPGPALAAFEAESSAPSGESFAAAQAAFSAWAAQQQRADPAGDSVPRALYDSLMKEKQDLQQKLFSLLEERNKSDAVPRELFDQAQAEKRQLQEKMMLMLDELPRLRQSGPPEQKEEPGPNVRPFPGSRKNE
jgi:hypothetical protein